MFTFVSMAIPPTRSCSPCTVAPTALPPESTTWSPNTTAPLSIPPEDTSSSPWASTTAPLTRPASDKCPPELTVVLIALPPASTDWRPTAAWPTLKGRKPTRVAALATPPEDTVSVPPELTAVPLVVPRSISTPPEFTVVETAMPPCTTVMMSPLLS